MFRFLWQLLGESPFRGSVNPTRAPLLMSSGFRRSLPFPHPWNFREPIQILESLFVDADSVTGSGRHTVYLSVPGVAPFLVTRDPQLIRAITVETGDKDGQFDRDTLPSDGIARATGVDSLLYSNGPQWRHQKKLAASPFGKSTLFQPENFEEFFQTFRETVRDRLEVCRRTAAENGGSVEVSLEAEIKPVMMEMLTNSFFGAEVSYDEIRNRYVPSLELIIDDIVRDTVMKRLPVPGFLTRPNKNQREQLKAARADFEQLTEIVLSKRSSGEGLWRQFKSDVPDEALKTNLRVFLAGALEATTSYAAWAISHLARHPEIQEQLYQELQPVERYSPEVLSDSLVLTRVLDETLRLTPSLYFLPRRATANVIVRTTDGRDLEIPKGTHVLLDVWHANRHEDHWGTAITGYPAMDFAPDRWRVLAERNVDSKEMLHFGFGHGPRVCPGKHLGQLEVALVVGSFVKLATFQALSSHNPAKAGVSTKPADGCRIRLTLREQYRNPDHPTAEQRND